jgi:AraC-like DNA-binding protein
MTPAGRPSQLRWDGYPISRLSDIWASPDFDDPEFRRAEQEGLVDRFAENGWRTFVRVAGGSGTFDRVRVRPGIDVCVVNAVLPGLDRRTYEADEGVLLLYASLACDMKYWVPGQAPIVLNRPELTLVSVPPGLPLTFEIEGSVRQQRMFGIFRPALMAEAFGLPPKVLPKVIHDAAQGISSFGRIVSMPLSHRVAGLVADTIDSPLQGEMRALQYQGRLAELVAYALQALQEKSLGGERPGRGELRTERDADIARRAKERLAREFHKPPDVDALARALGTNPNKLRAAFKAAFGITMADYCLERRMREAQQLLLQGRLTISQISERVGYEYPSGFAAAFAAHVGMTPRDYRRHRAPISVPLVGPDDKD